MLALPIATRRRKPGPRKKPQAVPFPSAEATRYVMALRGLLSALPAARKLITQRLPGILGQVQAPRADDVRSDLERLLSELSAMIAVSVERAEKVALEMIARVATRNAVQFEAAAEGVFTVNPLLGSEPWLNEQMALATAENVRLIKSIPEQLLSEVEGIISRGASAGTRAEDLAKVIAERFGVANSRATLIARDQVGKWSGSLTRLRQLDAGITEYVWNTSRDERVRPEHVARHGKTFKWSDPPSDGHPGQPIRCRCVAVPVIPEDA